MIRPKPARPSAPVETAAPDCSSLIDVAFLLLIYFLATSTLEPREGDLSLTTAGRVAGAAVPSIDKPLVEVDAEGRVSLGGEMLETDPSMRELPRLADRLRSFLGAHFAVSGGQSPAVELDVADGVPGQRFVDVVNCLASVGIADVAIRGLADPLPRR